MSITEKEYFRERQKLKETVDKIKQEIEYTEKRLARGFDDYTDEFMKMSLKYKFNIRIKNLLMIKPKPYFARVDFVEEGSTLKDIFYLGKLSVTDLETQKQIVVDWRAPAANLYYDGKLGESEYECLEGKIKGEIVLKRQYFITEGELENMVDIDVTSNDEMLQPYLGANSDNRLKNIISTIQTQQNRIIRSTIWKPLVVQGVAGSGKTTIALHRIAYLIYHYDKSFSPEEFLIIAPNKFFLNYISNVLPDLGVDRVLQNTYEEIGFEVIGKEFKIEEPNDKLGRIINGQKREEERIQCRILEQASQLKSSIRYKNLLDEYIYELEKRLIPQEDFKIEGFVVFRKSEFETLLLKEYGNLPLNRRMEEIKKHLINAIAFKRGMLLEEIEADRQYKIAKIRSEIEDEKERQKAILQIYEEKESLMKELENGGKKLVTNYLKYFQLQEVRKYYKEFMEKYFVLFGRGRVEEEVLLHIKETYQRLEKKHKIEMEDIAPLMYLKYCIHGIDTKFHLKHIVIDEAQDFSEFQFYIFKKIIKSNSLTILGDLAQGIYYYRGTQNWQKTMEIVFGEEMKPEYLTLTKTYRTTIEIMEVANQVIAHIKDRIDCPFGEPVIKNGEKVSFIKVEKESELISKIEKRIEELKSRGFQNIALITKTMQECEWLYKMLKREEIHQITNQDSEYKGGISIVPSYLAKGLEFDAVMITNANQENYTCSEVDTKLLYVAITRAMNTLDIYYQGEKSTLLE